MKFELSPVPYAKDALQPVMSAESVEYHYEKHHKSYVMTLQELLKDKPEASKTLEEIVNVSSGAVFNNAAQIWNHNFFWKSMQPQGGGVPVNNDLLNLINRDFGGWEKFREAFKHEGMSRFGSGWVWLVLDNDQAKIISTSNAETPLTTAENPLIGCDVWEHAYYIDYRNKRDNFLDAFCDRLINWDFAAKNLRV
jgi:Fe-Mn family superoxide dismutase